MKPTPTPPIRATHAQSHSKGNHKADVYLRIGANLHRARIEQRNRRALVVSYFPPLAPRFHDAARRVALAAMSARQEKYSVMAGVAR